jgi:ketosteroid isomerase-like protein
MWRENVEILRRGWDAWVSGDTDALFALYEWLEVWDAYEVGVEDILVADDGRVVSLAWQRGKGRESGLVMEMVWAQISTLRDGKIVRIDNYDDRSEALEAVGLSE